MKYRFLIIITVACMILSLNIHVYAGTGKRIATAGAMELLIPVGAHATALSGANIANVSGIEAMYWNPAGVVASDQRAEVMFSHLKWLGDINVEYLAATANLGAFGTIGLNVKTLNFGDIVETTVENPEGTGSVFSPNYITLGINYSRKMTDRIHFGVNMKIISEKIMSVSATGVAFDFGLQYVSPVSGIKLGVVITNFGSNMRFGGADLETRVQLPGTEAGTTVSSVAIPVASFDLPTQLKLGLSYDLRVFENNILTVSGSFVNNAYAFDQYIVSGEMKLRNMFFLRGAYALAYREGLEAQSDGFVSASDDFLFGPSFGGGLRLGLSPTMSLSIDYAYRLTQYFDNNQWVSLVLGF